MGTAEKNPHIRRFQFQRKRPHEWRSVTLFASGLAACFALFGQTAQPGATDPHTLPSHRTLYQNSQLLVTLPTTTNGTGRSFTLYQLNESGTPTTQTLLGPTENSGSTNTVAVAGRFLTEAKDQLGYLYSTGSNLVLQMWNGLPSDDSSGTPVFSQTFQNYAGPQSYGDAIAIAKGDLDNAVDANGMRHDELIVAYRNTAAATVPTGASASSQAYNITLAVVDCSACSGQSSPAPVVTTGTTAEVAVLQGIPTSKNTSQVVGAPNLMSISLATGDFDGDGQAEIALSYLSNDQIAVSVYRYTTNKKGVHVLKRLGTSLILSVSALVDGVNSTYQLPEIATATGDFNGTGVNDQLAIARVSAYLAGYPNFYSQPRLVAIGFNSQYQAVMASGSPEVVLNDNAEDAIGYPGKGPGQMKVELASGLFQFSPEPGAGGQDFNFQRSELALAMNTSKGVIVHPYSAYNGVLSDLIPAGTTPYQILSDLGTTNNFALAAGGFGGIATAQTQNPLWSLALSSVEQQKKAYENVVDVATFSSSGISVTQVASTSGSSASQVLPLVAYDYEGNSVYLGAPVHISAPQTPQVKFVVQEPPKHVYWDETTQQSVIISAVPSFYSSLTEQTGANYATTSTNTFDYGIGASAASSASATIGGGLDVGLAGAKASVTTALNAAVNYSKAATASRIDSQYASSTYTSSASAIDDDFIRLTIQNFDIWRYRVYGGGTAAQANGKNNYVDFVVPGPYIEKNSFGLLIDDYQPIQENGNLLSYPTPNAQGTYVPPDLGPYLPPGSTTPVTAPIKSTEVQYGQGTTGFDFNLSQNSSFQQSFTTNNSLKQNADVKVTVKGTANFLGSGGSVEASVDVGENTSFSWTQANTATNGLNSFTDFKAAAPEGTVANAYNYYPVIYAAQDGSIKLAYGAQPITGLGSVWTALYGQKPDPALNLPYRFTPTASGWTPTTGLARKKMRGFYLRQTTVNAITGEYDLLSGAPTAGDKVRVEARVYNYSLYNKAYPSFSVHFDLAQMTSDQTGEVPFTQCPANMSLRPNGRCEFGSVTVSKLGPQASTLVATTLDTTGLATGSNATTEYFVFVVLDREGTVSEIYPWEPNGTTDYGQNNEGFGLLTVMKPGSTSASATTNSTAMTASTAFAVAATDDDDQTSTATTPSATANSTRRDLSMNAHSLGAIDSATGSLRFDSVRVPAGQPMSIRVGDETDKVSNAYTHVMIYDGDPKGGGQLIAIKTLQPGDVGKPAYTWFDWTPRQPGEHVLYAEVLEEPGDTQPGNNITQLTVFVGPSRTVATR